MEHAAASASSSAVTAGAVYLGTASLEGLLYALRRLILMLDQVRHRWSPAAFYRVKTHAGRQISDASTDY